MQKSRIFQIVICALFAAMTAIFSQIAIPIGPVPLNLATFAVFCAGALLGPKLGALSLGIWALMGAAGVPVFAMFRGGLSVLARPTGGYILGYIPAAFITGLLIEKINKTNKIFLHGVAMLAGMFTYFALGTLWFVLSTNTGFAEAMTICVIPFLPGDFIKLAVAATLAHRLRPVLFKKADSGIV